MEDVIVFCNKTVEKVSSEISATESELNKNLQCEERQAIHETLKENDEINRKFLQQKKIKKFNDLKCKPKQNSKAGKFLGKNKILKNKNQHMQVLFKRQEKQV